MARRLRLGTDPETRSAALQEAGRMAQAGGVLAIPTESVYALSASARCISAIDRVYAIKGRPEGKPLLLLIAGPDQVAGFVAEVSTAAEVLMRRFWPGPLTIVFPAAGGLPAGLTAGTGTVGLRLSASSVLNEILRQTGPLTGTSANRSGEPPARTAEDVDARLGAWVDLVLDDGPTPGASPSTVISVCGSLQVLREGPVSRQEVQTALAAAGIAWGA